MSEMVAYVNGKFVPADTASITIFDRGLRWGDAVYDVERTFRHRIFRLKDHMARLERTLRYTRIGARGASQCPLRQSRGAREPSVAAVIEADRVGSGLSISQIAEATEELVRRNSPHFPAEGDMTVAQVITRGTLHKPDEPNVIIYCADLEWAEMARIFQNGVDAAIASTRRVPQQCLSPGAKISNKMSQMIAEREVKAASPDARALMLDVNGNLSEDTSANLFFVSGNKLFTPSLANCLPGISRMVTIELAGKLGIEVNEGAYSPFSLENADEAFLTSTSPCIYGIRSVNGIRLGDAVAFYVRSGGARFDERPIGLAGGIESHAVASCPGPVTGRLTQAWKDLVGLDFVEQARSQAALLKPSE